MAKIGLTKLNLTKNIEITEVEWNDEKIEVKQYLPIKEKLDMVSNILNYSIDDNGYYNPAKIYIWTIFFMLKSYTNINFTEKQQEDIFKTYDLLVSSGLSAKIFTEINPYEYQQIKDWVSTLINSIYQYKNSFVGIMEVAKEDYNSMDFDVSQIAETLSNPEDVGFLKDVLTKLG